MAPEPRHPPPRRGPLGWLVFLLAVAVTLTVMAGCVALVYGDALALL